MLHHHKWHLLYSSLEDGTSLFEASVEVWLLGWPTAPTLYYMIISGPAFNHESQNAIKLHCTEHQPPNRPAWLIIGGACEGAPIRSTVNSCHGPNHHNVSSMAFK